jgi:hypothetical protein
MLSGIAGMRQKQGNTEAGPVGRKSVGVTLLSHFKHTTIFNNSQVINKNDILLFINVIKNEPGERSSY